jgi:hypothetical protein
LDQFYALKLTNQALATQQARATQQAQATQQARTIRATLTKHFYHPNKPKPKQKELATQGQLFLIP